MFLPNNQQENPDHSKSSLNPSVFRIFHFIIKAHPLMRSMLVCQRGLCDKAGIRGIREVTKTSGKRREAEPTFDTDL